MSSDLLESLQQACIRHEAHRDVNLEIARLPEPSDLHSLIPVKDRYPHTFFLNTGNADLNIAWLSLLCESSSICEYGGILQDDASNKHHPVLLQDPVRSGSKLVFSGFEAFFSRYNLNPSEASIAYKPNPVVLKIGLNSEAGLALHYEVREAKNDCCVARSMVRGLRRGFHNGYLSLPYFFEESRESLITGFFKRHELNISFRVVSDAENKARMSPEDYWRIKDDMTIHIMGDIGSFQQLVKVLKNYRIFLLKTWKEMRKRIG